MSSTIVPSRPPGALDSARYRAAAHAGHGYAAELRPVSRTGHPRSRVDRVRFHAGAGDPEYRLGLLAGVRRRDCRPLRPAHHYGRGRGALRRRARHHGGGAGRARADRLRWLDRHCAVVHGDVARHVGLCARGFGAAAKHDARPRLRGGLARHARGPDRDAGHAGPRAVADRHVFFVLLAVAMLPAAFWAGGADKTSGPGHGEYLDARGAGSGDAKPAVPGDVGRLLRLRPQPDVREHAPARLSGAVRPGPDAERGGAGGDRRRQLDRLARRPAGSAANTRDISCSAFCTSCVRSCSLPISSCRRRQPARCCSRRRWACCGGRD